MTLIEALQNTLRGLHYSPRAEETYVHWTREFVCFHHRHPRELGAPEVTAFHENLAVRRHTSASTQTQSLCALVFLYRRVLAFEMPMLVGLERAKRPDHLPAVLSRREVLALLDRLDPPFCLIDGLLPTRVRDGLRARLDAVGCCHRTKLAAGRGEVDLPHALRIKIPGTATSLAWRYVFPASRPCTDPATGRPALFHLHETAVQKAVRSVVEAEGIDKRATCRVASSNGMFSRLAHGGAPVIRRSDRFQRPSAELSRRMSARALPVHGPLGMKS